MLVQHRSRRLLGNADRVVVPAGAPTSAVQHPTEHKDFGPDETREFPNGHAEIVNIGDGEVGPYTFEPGWRWSNDVKPIAGTHSCEAPHFQY